MRGEVLTNDSAPEVQLEPLLTARQVCRLLAVGERTLRRWVSSGRFPQPDVRIKKTIRWKRQTLRDVIEQGGGCR